MSKSLTPKKFMLAGWVVAVAGLAAIGVVVAASAGSGSAKSSGHRTAALTTVASKAALFPRVMPTTQDRIHAKYAALPLAFEKNEGQADPQIQYVARGKGYKLGLKSNQAVMTLPGKKRQSEVRDMMMNKRRGAAAVKAMLKNRTLKARHGSSTTASVEMNLLGANPHAQLVAEDLQRGKVNYYLGKDPSKWLSNVPLYGRVRYRNIYPGVDLAFHGAGKELEFDYLVSPGADAAAIALSFQGADSVQTNNAGNLVLATSAGPVQLNKPLAYQSKNGSRELVDAKFVLTAKNHVAFELGAYDHNRELVIDPTVTYSTYFGGDGADYGISVATDASADIFVAGATDSTSIPGNSNLIGGFDSFVTKIDITGAFFTVIFGGSGDDFPGGVAVDSQGIYIAGTTSSNNFPATVGQTFEGGTSFGNNDAYAIKFDLAGNFLWGTYIAGTDSDSGQGIAVDAAHNVYVVGETYSNDLGGLGGGVNALPSGTAVNLGTGPGSDDGYIAKLTSDGTAYSLISYIGGSDGDLATGVALDSSGNIYVSGITISADFPTNLTLGVVQGQCGTDGTCNASTGPFDDAFVVSIKANLSGYNYVTYYGGSGLDDAYGIAADANGNAYITGRTQSSDFPTAGSPFQDSLFGTQNAFLVKLNSSGTAASYSSYFGGDASDAGLSVAVDSGTTPNAYITGQTTSSSASFPFVNPLNTTEGGNSDAFVSVFGLSQGQILFSTFLGGGGDEDQFLAGIIVDPADNIYATGDTDSGNGTTDPFPTTTGALDGTYGGGSCMNANLTVPCTDAFITAYSPATAPDFVLSATPLSPSSVNAGSSATSTVTVADLNGYGGTVNLTCSVTGNGAPLPGCSFTNPTTLTVTTTGAAAAMNHGASGIYYAMWLPVVGLSLVGMRFTAPGTRKKRLLGFLLLGLIMAALFFLPACGGSSNNGGGGGGCTGCTPAGNYTVTVTGTDSVDATLTHSVDLSLTVN